MSWRNMSDNSPAVISRVPRDIDFFRHFLMTCGQSKQKAESEIQKHLGKGYRYVYLWNTYSEATGGDGFSWMMTSEALSDSEMQKVFNRKRSRATNSIVEICIVQQGTISTVESPK